MCTVCGCGQGEAKIEGGAHEHEHRHADGTVHTHPHDHLGEHARDHAHDHPHRHADGTEHSHPHEHGGDHAHAHAVYHRHADGTWHSHGHALAPDGRSHPHRHADGTEHAHPHAHDGDHDHVHALGADLDYGAGPAGAHAPGLSQERMVRIEQDILSKNNAYAQANRRRLADRGIFAVNLVSSPGSGKTTLLVRSIEMLNARVPIAVIEGDQQTSVDAERIRATGAPAIQVNTGKGCHLDAHMVGHAIERLSVADESLLLIENVGNLVCPADFDLGEAHKVVILSVTEGEDKPLKYPNMFRAADLMLVNKVDLLPYLSFDVEKCVAHARRVNPDIVVMRVSATTGEGMADWAAWLQQGVARAVASRRQTVEDLRRRVAELEARLGERGA